MFRFTRSPGNGSATPAWHLSDCSPRHVIARCRR